MARSKRAPARSRPAPPAEPSPAAPGRVRLRPVEVARLVTAMLFVGLGLVIVAQGVRLGAPWAYTMLGVLMAGLGAYRLRLAWVLWTHPADDRHPRPTRKPRQP